MWIVVTPDEDGNPLTLIKTLIGVHEMLDDPQGELGVTQFEGEEFLVKNPDPMYWPRGTAVLLKADVVVPRPVTAKWSLPQG